MIAVDNKNQQTVASSVIVVGFKNNDTLTSHNYIVPSHNIDNEYYNCYSCKMPRKDGLDTNVEMQTDFTETSRKLFIETFEAASREGLHAGFEDKPLSHITVNGLHIFGDDTGHITGSIAKEELSVGTLTDDYWTDPIPGIKQADMLDVPEEIKQHRIAIRSLVSKSYINDELDIVSAIVPGTIMAGYSASDVNGKTKRSTSSLDDRPSKANLAAAKFMAEQALTQVQVQGPTTTIFEYFTPPQSHDTTVVKLSLAVNCHLPLNGHEPRYFIENFMILMMNGVDRARNNLKLSESIDSPKFVTDGYKKLIEDRLSAAKQAYKILDI